jgi:hypothetical protein
MHWKKNPKNPHFWWVYWINVLIRWVYWIKVYFWFAKIILGVDICWKNMIIHKCKNQVQAKINKITNAWGNMSFSDVTGSVLMYYFVLLNQKANICIEKKTPKTPRYLFSIDSKQFVPLLESLNFFLHKSLTSFKNLMMNRQFSSTSTLFVHFK